MKINEAKSIVDKIRIYRPTFGGQFNKAGLEKLKIEWFRILEPYDYEDVDKELDKYFKNGDNFGRYPDVYYLIKYLKKSDEKLKSGVYYIRCQLCGKEIELTEHQNHYDRCSSVEYLYTMSEKYFNKKLNKEKLFNTDKKTFDDYYWKFCKELYEVIEEGLQKHILKNAILTHYGQEAEYGLNELGKDIKKI